jgi:serine/threonine protein kinase
MEFDLRVHGFTDAVISENLLDLSDKLPHWSNLPYLIVKHSESHLVEYLSKPIKDISGNIFLSLYEWGKKIDEGTYGKIYLCKRKKYVPIYNAGKRMSFSADNSSGIDIVIKESDIHLSQAELKMSDSVRKNIIQEETDAHMHEAAVLTLAYQAIKDTIPGSVPKVYEVFCKKASDGTLKSLCISMEYIKGETLLKNLRNTLSKDSNNDAIFINIITQLAKIIDVLQTKLRMNHRDIKVNNVLLRDKTNQVVLIDYGFACIANGVQEPAAELSKIQAGSYFGSRVACFKVGRDMSQFLYSLYCYFPFEKYISEKLLALIKPWMMIKYKYGVANLLNGLYENGSPSIVKLDKIEYNEGIYIFLKKEEVDPVHCSPKAILADLENYEKNMKA